MWIEPLEHVLNDLSFLEILLLLVPEYKIEIIIFDVASPTLRWEIHLRQEFIDIEV